jgi:ferredoxin
LKNPITATTPKHQNLIDIDQNILPSIDGESVLETLERANIDVHYNCREGFCGVCRTKLLAGTVEYRVEPLAFIDDDEILSCCTIPTSNIKIKMDY